MLKSGSDPLNRVKLRLVGAAGQLRRQPPNFHGRRLLQLTVLAVTENKNFVSTASGGPNAGS